MVLLLRSKLAVRGELKIQNDIYIQFFRNVYSKDPKSVTTIN